MNLTRIKLLLAYAKTLARLGPKSLLYNLHYRIGIKTGRYEKALPTGDWKPTESLVFVDAPWKHVDSENLREILADWPSVITSANNVVGGSFTGFSWCPIPLSGNWQQNPQTGYKHPRVHWSNISSLPGTEAGDIKWTWEQSRFEWVYILGRAWCINRQPDYPETFWRLLFDWRRDNPPQQGINWMSGQESALKIFALLWAAKLWIPEAQEDQRAALLETIAALTETIEAVIGYALSQRNNHGISEAGALYVVGNVLRDHPRSEKWSELGFQLSISEIKDQFGKDGSYIQHSNNYARVALRYSSILLTTAAWAKHELPLWLRELLLEAVKLLWVQQDKTSGSIPNYGANDGANPSPLNSCDYEDFRPILQCVHWQLTGERLYEAGQWDEELLWVYPQPDFITPLGGERPTSHAANQGGYYVLRGTNSQAMIRCTSLKSRPGHADMLHLDLWANGVNLLSDGGTFQYIDAHEWGSYLASTAAHNTIEINGRSQMKRGGRFLWLDWTRSKLLNFMQPEAIGLNRWEGQYVAGEHSAYYNSWLQRGIIHKRQILHIDNQWLVIDDLIAKRVSTYAARLHWHLDGVSDWEQLEQSGGNAIATARSQSEKFDLAVWGLTGNAKWADGEGNYPATLRSRFYGKGYPCARLTIEQTTGSSIRWVTTLGQESGILLKTDLLHWNDLSISLQVGGPISVQGAKTTIDPQVHQAS